MNRLFQSVFLGFCALIACQGASAQVSLYTAVDMALRNNPQIRVSTAEVQHAQAGLKEGLSVYKPSLLVGSGLAYTYGFPLGQPEVFNISTQSLAISFSQRDYIRSARAALQAAQLRLSDERQQTILDAALDYCQLNTVNQQIAALGQESGDVSKLVAIEEDRVQAGVDSKIEWTRARLTGAQVDLKRLQLQDQAASLRSRLSHLTGLSAVDLTPEAKTIPEIGAAELHPEGGLDSAVASNNNGVKAAYAEARSKLFSAYGDAHQNNRPIVNFVASYGLFSTLNNYSQYYLHFQENNLAAGIQINLPLFDASRKAKAVASSAEAARASAEADVLRNQASEQAQQLQGSLAELAAQEQVAELQREVAQDQLEAVTTQLRMGNGNPNAPPLTPKDEQQALINERSSYVDMLDAQFQLTQARLNLMRSLGTIEDWAKMIPQTGP